MVWLVKGVRCNSFRQHVLQCYTIGLMCFWLVYCTHDSFFKVSNIFSFVECEVFISIIRDKYIDRCLALDLMNATNYVDVWIPFLFGVVSYVRKYAIWVSIMDLLILIGMTPFCWGGILSVDLTVPIVTMQSQACV